jgi:heme-degrading monooxygenase HmoA
MCLQRASAISKALQGIITTWLYETSLQSHIKGSARQERKVATVWKDDETFTAYNPDKRHCDIHKAKQKL